MNLFFCLITGIVILFSSVDSMAKSFEWYKIKDGVSGVINFRVEPNIHSRILWQISQESNYKVILFKVVGHESGWLKVLSAPDGFGKKEKEVYFFVCDSLLEKADFKKDRYKILVPNVTGYNLGLMLHRKAHIFSEETEAIMVFCRYAFVAVKTTGYTTNSFIEIVSARGKRETAYVYGEFFGERTDTELLVYSKPKKLCTRKYDIKGNEIQKSLLVHEKSSILSKVVGGYCCGNMKIDVLIKKGDFYLTSKKKWIQKDCLLPCEE